MQAETAAGKYVPVTEAFTRGFTALGVVDKDHAGIASVWAVHNFSAQLYINLGIFIELALGRQSETLLIYSNRRGFNLTPHIAHQCLSTPINGHTSVGSGLGPHLQICQRLSVCAPPARLLTGSVREAIMVRKTPV